MAAMTGLLAVAVTEAATLVIETETVIVVEEEEEEEAIEIVTAEVVVIETEIVTVIVIEEEIEVAVEVAETTNEMTDASGDHLALVHRPDHQYVNGFLLVPSCIPSICLLSLSLCLSALANLARVCGTRLLLLVALSLP